MNDLYVYNSLSGKKELFKTIKEKEVKMYVCGPTVYASAHIGHALSAMTFDIIRRYLEHLDYKVNLVSNFTDVDDKIIIKANLESIPINELTERLMNEYLLELAKLNIKPATKYPKATEEIPEMISLIESLIKKDFAYAKNGNVFFRTNKAENYGQMSGRFIQNDSENSNSLLEKEKTEDFALWKFAKPTEPYWESPWGNGRPGWHIECSAMCIHHLGEQIDIHGGGNDLVFPHHENEIAQSEAFTGKQFANYWIHNGMLELQGGKMSKSSGSLITISDFLNQYDANTFRMMLISSHYRNSLAFSFDLAKESEKKVSKIKNALNKAWGDISNNKIQSEVESVSNNFINKFHQAMNNDFDTPILLKELFAFVKFINIQKENNVSDSIVKIAQTKLKEILSILGFNIGEFNTQKTNSIEEPLLELIIDIRQKLKENKNWELSDEIRKKLSKLNIELKDKKDKTIWIKK